MNVRRTLTVCLGLLALGSAHAQTPAAGAWPTRQPIKLVAVFPPGEAKEDWKILRALSEVLDRKVPLDTLGQVRARMAELAAPLNAIDRVEPAAWSEPGAAGALERQAFASPVADFYLTDPIGRASAVMAECSRLFVHGAEQEATGTHG